MSNLIKFPTGSKEQGSNVDMPLLTDYQMILLDREMRKYRRKRTDVLTMLLVFFFGMATGLFILAMLGIY